MKSRKYYTFPFTTHSAAFVQELDDKFWLLEENYGDSDEFQRNHCHPRNLQDKKSRNKPKARGTRTCQTCQKKLSDFKQHRLDPFIRNLQSFVEVKTTKASENWRLLRDVMKSEEFKNIKSNLRQGKDDSCDEFLEQSGIDPNARHKCPKAIRRIKQAANDTIFLCKTRKSEHILGF